MNGDHEHDPQVRIKEDGLSDFSPWEGSDTQSLALREASITRGWDATAVTLVFNAEIGGTVTVRLEGSKSHA